MGIFRRGSKGAIGSILWYASKQKLEAIETSSGISLESLSGKLDVGPASLQVGVKQSDPRIISAVRKAERRLRQSGNVMSAIEISKASPPSALFEFESPCSRLAAEGAFWFAGKSGSVATLLVGSLSNAVGGYQQDGRTAAIMQGASADPVGATLKLAAHLARVRVVDRIQGRTVEYKDFGNNTAVAKMSVFSDERQRVLAREQGIGDRDWREIDSEGLGNEDLQQRRLYPEVVGGAERLWILVLQGGLLDIEGGLSSLPVARGIAVYGNRRSFKPTQDPYIEPEHLELIRRLAPEVETIVIGSPIYVENIQTRTQAK
jgi:hypothetical protein